MSNSNSFVYKNGFTFFSLLLTFLFCSGFTTLDYIEENDRKKRKKIVRSAQKHIGTKYKAGGKNPRGFDCSGFVFYIMKENKIKMGASSHEQSFQGEPVKIKNLKQGDLIFFGSKSRINHVGIVVRQTRNELIMIHSSSSRGIIEEDVYQSKYWTNRIQHGRSVL